MRETIESLLHYFTDWYRIEKGNWSEYPIILHYGLNAKDSIEIGLYREPDDSSEIDDLGGTYTLQIFDGDNVIFCHTVEGLDMLDIVKKDIEVKSGPLPINDWVYGKQLLRDGVIETLEGWDDDTEMALCIMDGDFDYLWDFKNGHETKEIYFIDRMYSDGLSDETTEWRRENNELELHFIDWTEVFKWIASQPVDIDDDYWEWIKERLGM